MLASILAFVAIFSIWFNRQILNTDNWTKASSEMLESPVIRAELANYLSDQLYANVDVEAEIRNALPERAKQLAGPAASALRNQVEKRANQALQRPRVQALWEDANRGAHEKLLEVIDGGGGKSVSTEGGVVTIDLKTLLQETEQRVGVGGRVAKALPASATSIVVLQSDQLDTAQTIGRTLQDLPVVLVVLSLALFGIALAVSRGWRRRAVRGYGIGLAVAGAAVLVAEAWAGDAVVESFAGTASMEPVVRTVWDIYTPLLNEAATAAIFYGLRHVPRRVARRSDGLGDGGPPCLGAVSARAGDRLRRVRAADRHRGALVGAHACHAQSRHGRRPRAPARPRLRDVAPPHRARVPRRRP